MTEPSYKDWYAGMRVVCVDAGGLPFGPYPVEGKVYTIRRIIEWNDRVGVSLAEIVLPYSVVWEDEYGVLASRFRPLVTRKADIRIFRALLNPTTAGKVRA